MNEVKGKRILILSDACFNDNIFPLYKTFLEKGYDVTCLIKLTFTKVMLFDIEKRLPIQGIIKAIEYPELMIYKQYMNMDKVYLVNHEIDRYHPWRDLTSTFAIIGFIRKGKFDVIHTDHAFWNSNILLYVFRKKIINITHDTFPHSGTKNTFRRRFFMKLKYRLLNTFVILNNADYERFCNVYNLNKKDVFINRLGPLDCIRMYLDESIVQDKYSILFFGRITKYKGVEYLCEAMKIVHDKCPQASLTIAGSGDFYFDINPYKELPYIKILNRFIEEKELANLIQTSSMTVCAYTDATQSGSVLTSFAFYKPVIVSDVETLREVVTDRYNGLVVPVRNPTKLSEAILELINNENLYLTIKTNIEYEFNYGDNSWNSITDKYLQVYNRVL